MPLCPSDPPNNLRVARGEADIAGGEEVEEPAYQGLPGQGRVEVGVRGAGQAGQLVAHGAEALGAGEEPIDVAHDGLLEQQNADAADEGRFAQTRRHAQRAQIGAGVLGRDAAQLSITPAVGQEEIFGMAQGGNILSRSLMPVVVVAQLLLGACLDI